MVDENKQDQESRFIEMIGPEELVVSDIGVERQLIGTAIIDKSVLHVFERK
jgi:hypothetical protein